MKFVRLCPKCGSTKVVMSRDALKAVVGAQSGYQCQNCDFEGVFFPEVEEKEIEGFLKDLQKN